MNTGSEGQKMQAKDAPWQQVAEAVFPVELNLRRDAEFDALFDFPAGSACTVARVNAATGGLEALDWRGKGAWGFYPASIVKWVTCAMALGFLDRHGLPIDAVLHVGDDKAMTFRELLAETMVFSGNETFNTLQEAVGFAETYAEMRRWGVREARIRRHFRHPRYNHSRAVRVTDGRGRLLLELAERPAAEIPFHDNNVPGSAEGQSNWWSTNDLVRATYAILFGPTRRTRYFPMLTTWAGMTNQCRVRDGLREVTGGDAGHPGFVILNKPGWWPDDSSNVEMTYVYDMAGESHYLVGMYYHGTLEDSAAGMAEASRRIFRWLGGRL
jgi:hypothetical protein